MQTIAREHLVDAVEIVVAGHAAEQVVVEHHLLIGRERSAPLPHLTCPERRGLWNLVPLPDLQHPAMALKRTGMFDAQEAIDFVDESAATHHHVPSGAGVDRLDNR